MKIEISEATILQLNWLVAKCEGATNLRYDTVNTWWVDLNGEPKALSSGWSQRQNWHPSTNWAQGGPIIERENIGMLPSGNAYYERDGGTYFSYGPTPLIAAMRCYVASKLGTEIDVPKELL
jgi:hypothetical protein